MSDLIVIGYPDEKTAATVWQELVKLQEDHLVDLEDAAISAATRRASCTSPRPRITPWRGVR